MLFLWPVAGFAQNPVFEPVAAPAHIYQGGWEHFVGGGIASFDCDGDSLPELFAAGGSAPAILLKNRSTRGGSVRFEEQTPDSLAITGVTGAYPIDIDSDGAVDLVILRVGPNLILKGDGACGFATSTDIVIEPNDRWTTAFSATWEAGSELPTLAFGNYVDRSAPDGPFGACDQNELYRPASSRYGAAQSLTPGFCPLSMLFSDWGRNGRADLRISNDRHYYVKGGQEQMWAMEPLPRLFTKEEGWQPYQIWGMGIASRDLSGDGLPDVYLTSMADQKLQVLESANSPRYRDATYEMGTTAQRPYTGGDGRPSTGWQVSFGDVQNDGLDDIFIAKGNVDQMPGSAMEDPNNLLVQSADGTFLEQGLEAGIATLARSRGAALVDFNLDGLLDLAVVNRRAPIEIYQNTTPVSGQWLSVDARQPAPNLNAIGAWIELRIEGRTMAREITIGGGHAGGALGPQHFGLGAAESGEIRIIWPDGKTSQWASFSANSTLILQRSGSEFDMIEN